MGIILWVWDRNRRDFKSDYVVIYDTTIYVVIYVVIYGESRIIPVILFTM